MAQLTTVAVDRILPDRENIRFNAVDADIPALAEDIRVFVINQANDAAAAAAPQSGPAFNH